MPEPVAANTQWQYDYIPEYNLSEKVIGGYLKEIWGNYKYFVEVSPFVTASLCTTAGGTRV